MLAEYERQLFIEAIADRSRTGVPVRMASITERFSLMVGDTPPQDQQPAVPPFDTPAQFVDRWRQFAAAFSGTRLFDGTDNIDKIDFSGALLAVKAGHHITRAEWLSRGTFVMRQAGYPHGIPINPNTADATGFPVGTRCTFRPYLAMCTGPIGGEPPSIDPWEPQTHDVLATDWMVLAKGTQPAPADPPAPGPRAGLGITPGELAKGTAVMVPVGRLAAKVLGQPCLVAWAIVVGPVVNAAGRFVDGVDRWWLDVYTMPGGDPLPQMYRVDEILGVPALGLTMDGAPPVTVVVRDASPVPPDAATCDGDAAH